jgi:hypothetical protein
MSKNRAAVFVLPVAGKWHVQIARRTKSYKVLGDQKAAIQAGHAVAISMRSELIVMRENGTIRSKDSFERDPFPPRMHK